MSEKREGTSNKKKNRWISAVGFVSAAVVIAVAVVFVRLVGQTQLLPEKMMDYLRMALGGAALVISLFLLNHRNVVRYIIGVLLAIALIAALYMGGKAVQRGVEALNRITTAQQSIEYIGVYVLKENPIPHLEDAGDYMFGLWSGMDTELAKKTVATLNEALKTQIKVSTFEEIPDLLDALFNKQIDAMIFPDAFFGLLVDMEGYQDTEEKIRPLITLDFEIETGELEKPEMPDHTFTVYISGIDSRVGMIAKSRSDVNILAHVNTKTHQVLLVSTPRDYYVPLSISEGIPDKLTHAGIYGVDVSKDTVGMIYDMDIDYHFRVNFEGFEEIIDALGGVDVYSQYTFWVGPDHWFYEGMNHLNGEEALIFARERYSFSEGDRQRGKHQMELIRAVINKALSPGILKNYVGVLEAVEGNFETTVPYELIAQLVRDQLESNPEWEIISYSVSGTGDTENVFSMSIPVYVLRPDWDTVNVVKDMIAKMEDNERISAP